MHLVRWQSLRCNNSMFYWHITSQFHKLYSLFVLSKVVVSENPYFLSTSLRVMSDLPVYRWHSVAGPWRRHPGRRKTLLLCWLIDGNNPHTHVQTLTSGSDGTERSHTQMCNQNEDVHPRNWASKVENKPVACLLAIQHYINTAAFTVSWLASVIFYLIYSKYFGNFTTSMFVFKGLWSRFCHLGVLPTPLVPTELSMHHTRSPWYLPEKVSIYKLLLPTSNLKPSQKSSANVKKPSKYLHVVPRWCSFTTNSRYVCPRWNIIVDIQPNFTHLSIPRLGTHSARNFCQKLNIHSHNVLILGSKIPKITAHLASSWLTRHCQCTVALILKWSPWKWLLKKIKIPLWIHYCANWNV